MQKNTVGMIGIGKNENGVLKKQNTFFVATSQQLTH